MITAEDQQIGERAEHEAQAQLSIVQVLKGRSSEERWRILQAVQHLLEADRLVPGVLQALAETRKGK